jgi:TRAP-type mannitol/chloroaromatic compound transport system permease small subunit
LTNGVAGLPRAAAPLSRLDRFAVRLGGLLSWLFGFSVLITAFEVVMRYVFNRPTVWVHDLTIAVTAVCFVFGGAYALARSEHIRITTVHDHMSPRWRAAVDFVGDVAIMLFLGALTWAAAHQAWRSILLVETSGRAWDVPIPPVLKATLALGTALMTAQAALRLWMQLRDTRRG